MNSDPLLRYKYAEGLGDVIACTLHSKYIQPITTFLTKSKKMCMSCQTRRQALNVLFPIKLWRFFFQSMEKRLESLDEEFLKIKMQWQLNTSDGKVTPMKYSDIYNHLSNRNKEPIPEQKQLEEMPDYIVVGKSDTGIGDFLIRNIIFKRL
jgi:hypothetical protein